MKYFRRVYCWFTDHDFRCVSMGLYSECECTRCELRTKGWW